MARGYRRAVFWWGEATDEPGHKQAREYARPTSPANKEGELYRWGEATDEPHLLSGPNQIKNSSFERPSFNRGGQSFSQGILLYIEPLLRVILTVAQSVMPAARLKLPFRPPMLQTELAFPVGNPRLNSESQLARRAKRVEMIRHKQVIAHEPCCRPRPDFTQKSVRHFVGEPRSAFLRGDSEENNVRLSQMNMDAW